MPDEPVVFTVFINLRVWGPEAEWDDVAAKLERRLEGMRLAGGYIIGRASRDEAANPSSETEA